MTADAPRRHLPALGLLALLLLSLFFRSFDPDLTLSSGDANLTVMRNMYDMGAGLFTGTWAPGSGLGGASTPTNVAPGFLLSFLVPFFKYVDANALFHLFLMGLGGYFLVHDLTRNRFASFAGGLFLMLQPHVISHLLPGHIGHFLMAGWVPLLVLFTRRAVLAGGLNWLYAGACAGALISAGQHDVGAFFCLAVAAYGLFLLIRTRAERKGIRAWAGLAGGIAAGAALALLISFQALFSNLVRQVASYTESTSLGTEKAESMDESQKWFWATQWSIPPVETADMAIPGFFGWGSSDPVNPYRGRIGQTEGWMTHHQGMPNLNDVCQYLGGVLLLGALLALTLRRKDPEVLFFAVAGLVALLLSFGKFAPVYRLFYAIPGMETLRNPIKWFYVTSLFAGLLGAIGLAEASRLDRPAWPRLKGALLAFLPGAAVLILGAILLGQLETNPFPYWQQPALVSLTAAALAKAALVWGAAGLAVFLMLTSPRKGRAAGLKAGAALAALTLAGELIYVNTHYLPYQRWQNALQAGAFRPFLDSVKKPCRFRFLRPDGPFHQLREVAVMEGMELADPYPSRLPDEYLNLQRVMEPADPIKFWRLVNVRYIVAPGALPDPRLETVLSLKAGKTPVVVSRLKQPLERCTWISSWQAAPRAEAAALMAKPAFDPGRMAVIHAEDPALPSPPDTPDSNALCRIVSYAANRVASETESAQPGLVVFSTRHDPNWKAYLDDREVPIWRANGLMQACAVPAGRHRLEWRFALPDGLRGLRLSLAGWTLALLAALAGIIQALRRKQEKQA
jgi:hypothetical protein